MYQHEYRERVVKIDPQPRIHTPPMAQDFWSSMQVYLEARGLSYKLAVRNGWYPSDSAGDGLPRVVIPCNSDLIDGTYWQARLMTPGEPRYQSPRAKRLDAFVLVHPEGRSRGSAVVEGPMDALACAEAGLMAVGLMGNTPPALVLGSVVRRLRGLTYAIADQDALGAMTKVAAVLISMGRDVRLVECPNKDVAAIPPDERKAWFEGILV